MKGVEGEVVSLPLLEDVVKGSLQVVLVSHIPKVGFCETGVQVQVVLQGNFHPPGKLPCIGSPGHAHGMNVCVRRAVCDQSKFPALA